jgi:hypothetical protein
MIYFPSGSERRAAWSLCRHSTAALECVKHDPWMMRRTTASRIIPVVRRYAYRFTGLIVRDLYEARNLTSLELQQCLRALVRDGLIGRFAIYGHKSVKDSKADCIHSLASPRDQHGWDHALHPPKPTVAFSIPLYRELCAIAVTAGQDFDALEQRVKFERKLYDTGANRL